MKTTYTLLKGKRYIPIDRALSSGRMDGHITDVHTPSNGLTASTLSDPNCMFVGR